MIVTMAKLLSCSATSVFDAGMRELLRAVMQDKPIITIIEPEKKHGGVTYDMICERLEVSVEMMDEWGLTAEARVWQFEEHLGDIPTAHQLVDALFNRNDALVLEWNRVRVRECLFCQRPVAFTCTVLDLTYG